MVLFTNPVRALLAEVATEEVMGDCVAVVVSQVERAPDPVTVAEVPQQNLVAADKL